MCDLRRRPAWPIVLPPLGLLLSRSAFFARHIFSQKLVSQGNELLQLLALDGRISSHVFVSCAAIVPVESPSEHPPEGGDDAPREALAAPVRPAACIAPPTGVAAAFPAKAGPLRSRYAEKQIILS